MPDLALHFTVPAGADARALADALAEQVAALPEVAAARAHADTTRAIGPQEITVMLTTGKELLTAAAGAATAGVVLVKAVRELMEQVKALAAARGMGGGRVEAGMRQVPIESATDEEVGEAVGAG